MKYYDRIDVSEVIDVNKTNASKKCIIYHYRYFLDKWFRFQTAASNGWHDILMMSVDINNISILNIHGVDFRCIIVRISKIEAIKLLKIAYLSQNIGSL